MGRNALDPAAAGTLLETWKGPVGLVLVLAVGLGLLAVSMRSRARGRPEIRPTDLALLLLPLLVWLLVSGRVTKLSFGGVEVVREAILDATEASVEGQVTAVGDVVHELQPASRGAKGSPDLLQQHLERRVQALEFRLGRGNYYVGSVIQEYLDALFEQPFFHYVVIFGERGELFGMFRDEDLVPQLRERPRGHEWLADVLNDGGAEAREELRGLEGFVSGEHALDPTASKLEALALMEAEGLPLLPVVDPRRGFVGVVERSRVTASMILDISRSLERAR